MLQEERAFTFAKEFSAQADKLERHWYLSQVAHMSDELEHIRTTEMIITLLWDRASRTRRALNARLLQWMIGNFLTTPRHAVLKVVDVLITEYPELAPLREAARAALRQLGGNRSFQETLYSRANVPGTMAQFDRVPEFKRLESVLTGYTHAG